MCSSYIFIMFKSFSPCLGFLHLLLSITLNIWGDTNYISGTLLGVLSILSYLILTIYLWWGYHYYPLFTDEAQRCEVICLRLYNWLLNPSLSQSEVIFLNYFIILSLSLHFITMKNLCPETYAFLFQYVLKKLEPSDL